MTSTPAKDAAHAGHRRISFFYPSHKALILDKLQAVHLLDKGEPISKDALACAIFEEGLAQWLRRDERARQAVCQDSGGWE